MQACEPISQKIRAAIATHTLDKYDPLLFQHALDQGVITQDEKVKMETMETMKRKAIDVDEFEPTYFANAKIL